MAFRRDGLEPSQLEFIRAKPTWWKKDVLLQIL
jgi:hypothetical protein